MTTLKDQIIIQDIRSLLHLTKDDMNMIIENQRASLLSLSSSLSKHLRIEDKMEELRY
jgi:hypothetical protein